MDVPGLAVGRCFGGRYRSERLLKTGQGIETHLGTEVTTGDPVVIKVTDAATYSSGAAMRLEHEAEVLRHLQTPLVAPLLFFGRDAGSLYLVMPFVPGVTLAERLHGERLGVAGALALGRALLGALAEAHEHGVLHRDVKPANLIVDERGRSRAPS
ncbi:MAG: hypothetical protein EXR72_00970 [Myxococcales bacterium]|nr:hypothetical protein [Myxococcales bacterium]